MKPSGTSGGPARATDSTLNRNTLYILIRIEAGRAAAYGGLVSRAAGEWPC